MHSLFVRLLLLMCGVAAGSALLALLLLERSLSRDLEAAAGERLDAAAAAAESLLASHLDAQRERYRAISGTPQLRATLEIGDGPTLTHYAGALAAQQRAEAIVFLGVDGRPVAGAGERRVGEPALAVRDSGVIAEDGTPFAVVSTPLEGAGRLVALEAIDAGTLGRWSELVGARVSFEPRAAPAEALLVRRVRRVGDLELRVTSTLHAEREAMAHARWNLAVAGAVALAAAFVLCGLASRSWVKPILELRSAAETIGSGDLSVEIASERRDEIGDVVRAFGAMLRGLRSTVGEVIRAADGVESTAGRIAQATRRLVDVAAAQARGNAEAASALERIDAQVAGIAASAAQSERTLDLAVDGSSSSMRELSRSGDSLEESARELWDQTEAVGDSIERMITGALEVAGGVEALLPVVEGTASSATQMAASARSVSSHVEETARLSQRVVAASETGRARVQETVAGMEAIREATDEARATIGALADQAREIGGILTVIEQVTGDADLLALNAAIIASQAGERGRAFAVVADQMKALARRVQVSTQEIHGLVARVQDGSSHAVAAVERGAQRVENGVARAREAEASLDEIARAARESGDRMSESVGATAEQMRASAHVVERTERVQAGVVGIRAATHGQERSNDEVRKGSDALRAVAQRVRETIASQALGAARIGESIETVQRTVREITGGLREQGDACERAAQVVGLSKEHIHANEESAESLGSAARELEHEAEALRDAVRRFRI